MSTRFKIAKQLPLIETRDIYSTPGAPAPPSNVGLSDRSVGKHLLLDWLLGKQCGVMSVKYPERHFVMHDLNTGTGRLTWGRWDESCSAGIFVKHLEGCARLGVNASGYLSEVAPRHWEELRDNLKRELTDRGWEIQDGERASDRMNWIYRRKSTVGIEAGLRATPGRAAAALPGEVGFVFHDPNCVSEPFPSEFINIASGLLICMLAMGFNAHGLKREGADVRRRRLDRIEAVKNRLHWHQDLCLVSLMNDSAHWAYLVVCPKGWKSQLAAQARSSFARVGFRAEAVFLRDGAVGFNAACRRLILTTREIERGETVQI